MIHKQKLFLYILCEWRVFYFNCNFSLLWLSLKNHVKPQIHMTINCSEKTNTFDSKNNNRST